jgi:hypothetical protein
LEGRVAVLMWKIWHNRNSAVWNNTRFHSQQAGIKLPANRLHHLKRSRRVVIWNGSIWFLKVMLKLLSTPSSLRLEVISSIVAVLGLLILTFRLSWFGDKEIWLLIPLHNGHILN